MLTRDCNPDCFIDYDIDRNQNVDVHVPNCINDPDLLDTAVGWSNLLDHENPAIDNDIVYDCDGLRWIGVVTALRAGKKRKPLVMRPKIDNLDTDFDFNSNTYRTLAEPEWGSIHAMLHRKRSPEGVSYFPKDESSGLSLKSVGDLFFGNWKNEPRPLPYDMVVNGDGTALYDWVRKATARVYNEAISRQLDGLYPGDYGVVESPMQFRKVLDKESARDNTYKFIASMKLGILTKEQIRAYWGLDEPSIDDHIILGYN